MVEHPNRKTKNIKSTNPNLFVAGPYPTSVKWLFLASALLGMCLGGMGKGTDEDQAAKPLRMVDF